MSLVGRPVSPAASSGRNCLDETAAKSGCPTGHSRRINDSGHESKIKLIHVTPASAFCNSETSIARVPNPDRSNLSRVRGNPSGITTVSPIRKTSAAHSSATSIIR